MRSSRPLRNRGRRDRARLWVTAVEAGWGRVAPGDNMAFLICLASLGLAFMGVYSALVDRLIVVERKEKKGGGGKNS